MRRRYSYRRRDLGRSAAVVLKMTNTSKKTVFDAHAILSHDLNCLCAISSSALKCQDCTVASYEGIQSASPERLPACT